MLDRGLTPCSKVNQLLERLSKIEDTAKRHIPTFLLVIEKLSNSKAKAYNLTFGH